MARRKTAKNGTAFAMVKVRRNYFVNLIRGETPSVFMAITPREVIARCGWFTSSNAPAETVYIST